MIGITFLWGISYPESVVEYTLPSRPISLEVMIAVVVFCFRFCLAPVMIIVSVE